MQYRFFVNDRPAETIALRHVERDGQAARLSLPFRLYYRLLRPLLPLWIRQRLQSSRRAAPGDTWYLPDEFLRDFVQSIPTPEAGLPVIHPWPHGARSAFVLTHDVETAEGLRNAMRLADVEEELGFRSSFNLVPYKYDIDPGFVRELDARGFEIGIHGYNHDGRLYLSSSTFERRVPAINAALQEYGAVGFRSPMVHRNLQWLQLLDIEYDSSCFDVDPFQAMPGGVGSIWPFMAGQFVELPYTLPQDHTLFIVLGERDGRVWEHKLRYVSRHGGMALMLTHPDYLISPRHLAIYRDFLARANEQRECWHALPKAIANWWKHRDSSRLEWSSSDGWTIAGPAAKRGVPAIVGAQDNVLSIARMSTTDLLVPSHIFRAIPAHPEA